MSYYNYNDWNTFNMDEGYLELFDMSQYDPFSGAPADLDRCFLESYPLSRYSSSDGSSPLPAGPASPETHYSFNGDTIQPTVLHPSAPSPYYVDPYTSAPPYQPQEPRRVPSGSKRPRYAASPIPS